MIGNSLELFMPLVDFIGEIFGADCEVVLYDLTNADNSIVAIRNNSISGRKTGDPITDFGLEILKENKYNDKQYVTKYSGRTKDGKILKASTFFIRNTENKIIGMFCININVTKMLGVKEIIDNFISDICSPEDKSRETYPKAEISENFTRTIEELVMAIIENTVSEADIPPERMSSEEKMDIVHKLNEKGVFLLKGAVTEVARQLKASENTIYRYLNKKD